MKINPKMWDEVSQSWPDPILLKNVEKLSGYPYSRGYTYNLGLGKDGGQSLKAFVFQIGKFPAVRRRALVEWLNKRTIGGACHE